MNYRLVLENSSLAAFYPPNTIFYLNIIVKIRVQKIEDQMLYYGCKDSGLLWN